MFSTTHDNMKKIDSHIDCLKTHIDNIIAIGNVHYNLSDYNYIPTVRYKSVIEPFAKKLLDKCGFDKFAILIRYNNKKYWLSNTYDDLAIPHDIYQLSQLDLSNIESTYQGKTHFFPTYEIQHPIYDLYQHLIQDFYHFFTIYVLTRICHECHILLFAGATSHPSSFEECKRIYRNTHDDFENFVIEVLDHLIYTFLLTSPNIKLSRIYNDANFRKMIIKGQYNENFVKLTEQEIQCLHWASLGKTAEDSSTILQISPYTVRQHLKDAITKLNAANITNAVYKANLLHLI